MGRASTRLHRVPGGGPALPGQREPLAEARDRFLASEPVDRAAVREPILASWWRSREWNVAANRLDLSYLGAPDLDTTLARAAEPVLRHLHEQLDGQPISIILTDASGLVLLRYTGDHDLERQLDSIMLVPGFSYAEEVVGTNGIGTALESGGPTHVFGHEHYAEHLEGMACAGVPVRDPRVRQDGRRHRPDLLAAGRRPADGVARPVHRRPAHPGARRDEQRPGRAAAAGVHPGLPAYRRHRARPRQRRGHAQRPRAAGAVPRRPGGADRAGDRDAVRGGRDGLRDAGTAAPVGRGDGGPAERRGGPDVLPPGRRVRPARRVGRACARSPTAWCT